MRMRMSVDCACSVKRGLPRTHTVYAMTTLHGIDKAPARHGIGAESHDMDIDT
jgi:hypothetical protein